MTFMSKFYKLILILVLVLNVIVLNNQVYAKEQISTTKNIKHYDPLNIGHVHQCPRCGTYYNQPGDNGLYSQGTYVCPKCGFNAQINQPNNNLPYPPNNVNLPSYYNPYNDPSYDAGFRDGYYQTYNSFYTRGYQEGLRKGEQDGYNNGYKAGMDNYNSKYFYYKHTNEKLEDLIKRLQIGQNKNLTIDNINSETLNTKNNLQNPNTKSYYAEGYREGARRGQTDGFNDGIRDGSKQTYPQAYNKGYQDGYKQADIIAHGDQKKYTFEEQFKFGLEALSRNDYWTALFRFNLILIEEPTNNSQFKTGAFWYAGYTKMLMKEYDIALAIFILHYLNNPNVLTEDTIFNIGSLLLEVKTGGFLGIGATKYYDKAKEILLWWINKYPNSKKMPEAYLKLGMCYEKLKDKENAISIYQKVINLYPNTTFADEAQKRIKSLNSWLPWK